MIYSQHFDAIFVAGNISYILIHIQILSGLFNFYYDVTIRDPRTAEMFVGPGGPPGSVLDFEIFWVLVRIGLGLVRLSRSWSELVRDF